MNWLNIGLLFSIMFILYSVQQIKMTLKEKGYDVDIFSNPIDDYNRFKKIIDSEKDARLKARYQGMLNGLYMAFGGTVVLGYLIFGQR